MKNNRKEHTARWWLLVPAVVSMMLCVSCREEYYLDEQEPTWLGESIYDFLVQEGDYTYYVRMIDSLGQTPVLSKTGSKTLFVVNDKTFDEFFKNNEWGVTCFEDLSYSQMEQIFYSSMLNNVFFSHMLGNESDEESGRGMTLRRTSAVSGVSSYGLSSATNYPGSYYWGMIPEEHILRQDNTPAPMVCFTHNYLIANSLKGEDYALLTNQDPAYVYSGSDIFVNGVRVDSANLKCKNGVVHRLEKLVVPLTNMAQVVTENENTKDGFGVLLDRFSAPYQCGVEDDVPVYVKKYFTKRGHSLGLTEYYPRWATGTDNVAFMTTPTDSAVGSGLKFDPGWNTLTSSDVKAMNRDMAAMFVPSTSTMEKYWEMGGKFLQDKYGTWDNVPDYVVVDLLNNHMKSSFATSVPSKFDQVKNDAQLDMGVKWEDVIETVLCCNGVVYITNKVYPPVSYVAVTAPTLVNDNMKVIDWATKEFGFLAYLHSMDSYYSFVLPTDEAFTSYLDPLSVAKGNPETWSFYYNADYKRVDALVRDTAGVEKTLQGIQGSAAYNQIQNRLEDLIDQHIIVDTIDHALSGKLYYQTKGNGTIKVVPGSGQGGLDLNGGYQLETNAPIAVSKVSDHSVEGNGKTYIVNKLMQSSFCSAYEAMAAQAMDENAPFYEFFNLMMDAGVFFKDKDFAMSSAYTVDLFNTFHYTFYIPTNKAVEEAYNNGLPRLEDAAEFVDSLNRVNPENTFDGQAYLDSVKAMLHDFVCYHIHDNSVYVNGDHVVGRKFQTGTLDMTTNTFRRLTVDAGNGAIAIVDGAEQSHKVNVVPDKEGELYNIMTRDYLFDNEDIQASTLIETSSFAVIHALEEDKVLLYDMGQLERYKRKLEEMRMPQGETTNE